MKHLYCNPTQPKKFIRKLWLLAAFLVFSLQLNAQCPQDDVILTSQAAVNNFRLNYPNCTAITGTLIIVENVTDLSPLSNITSVGGSIYIHNTQVTNLDDLSSLTAVEGISIQLNPQLNDISGLENINIADVFLLNISDNPELSACNIPNFCESLAVIPQVIIADNAPGCSNLEEVVAACNPVSCETPTAITSTGIISDKATINWTGTGSTFDIEWGVSGFTQGSGTTQTGVSGTSFTITQLTESTPHDVYIRQNCTENQSDWVKHTFTTLSVCPEGVQIHEFIPGKVVFLNSQEVVTNFGLMYPNCTHIENPVYVGYFDLGGIHETDITDLSALNNIQSVDQLHILATQLTDVNGLSSLTNVTSTCYIGINSQLTDISGLSSLTNVGSLQIAANPQLTNISGLQNINSISERRLYIMENPLLSVCNIASICTYLQGSDYRNIYGNAPGCESETAVIASCPIPCLAPTEITSTDVTSVHATINWTGEGELFDIEWGVEGFVQGQGNLETGLPVVFWELFNLTAETSYDVYVRQNCTDGQSDWVKHTFTTLEQPPCPIDGFTFNMQADVDAFALAYPNCTQLPGSLFITGNAGGDISDLSPLNNIETIEGTLFIANNFYLPNLDGLSSLTTVGGFLQISNNYALTNLDGLSNLTQLTSDITIAYNDQLTSVAGLSGLTTINPTFGDGLVIFNNMVLSTCEIDLFCDYLSNDSTTHPRTIHDNGQDCNDVETILLACNPPIACPEGDVIINSQDDLDFYAANYPFCTIINGNLLIENSDITELSVLNNIQTVTGELYILGNSQLINVDGMSSLQSVGSNLYLAFNDNLSNIDGLSSLTTIGGFLNFDYNPLVNNLDGFIALETIVGELIIGSSGLTNIDGLSNLREVGGEGIFIVDNSVLQDVSGLAGVNLDLLNPIDEYGGIIILYNPLLSVCSLPNLCAYLSDPANPRSIADNAPGCEDSNAVMVICSEPSYDGITWTTDNVWSNETGPASTEDDIYIEGNLMTTGDLLAKNITVRNGGNFVISSGNMLTLAGKIINEAGAANFVVESGANLIQTEEIENEGSITVVRDSNPMKRLDYTLWSSPVANQNLFGFSPETVNGVTNYEGSTGRIYIYNEEDGYVNPDPFTEEAVMDPAVGYLFRAPNNYHATNEIPYEGKFTGVPNNGYFEVSTFGGGYVSLGNPYPSNISADEFLAGNLGVSSIYFWNNTGVSGSNYATYTFMGGTAAGNGYEIPDGIISVGQGFIVETVDNWVEYVNEMRTTDQEIFFKANADKHRFWLDLNNQDNMKINQILVGYMDGATNGLDNQIDGKHFQQEVSALYSLINEQSYAVQGRALPFEATDVVPLGFKAAEAGKFSISLNDFDGLFAEGETIIFLNDKDLNIKHNLMDADYTFESAAGEFKSRFEIIYETEEVMGTEDLASNSVQIYTSNDQIVVSSKSEKILSVELYDLSGRNIFRNEKVNSNHYQFQSISKGVLVVKVQTNDGELTTKKLITK